ncbi:MAG: hypothetical protein J2P36_17005, partial [Ktedonobacteraceae bacterium]|nr:hypothetical protein [Ktedonobacteraceae bacterium]
QVPFLSKLLHATLHTCFIYMRGQHFDELTSDLWRHFHAEPRYLSPSYIHALDVLYEMGVYAHAEIVRAPQSLRYPSLDIAVEEQLEQLILPNNDATRAELHALLSNWLIERDGALILPQEYMVSAILRIDASDLSPIPIKYTIT